MAELKIAPGLLVAVPQLKDPNFENTVILMIEHDDEKGALGLVINRTMEIELETVLKEMEIQEENKEEEKHQPIFYGGPVSTDRGWIIHTPDWACKESQTITEGLLITTSLEILKAIAKGNGPLKYKFCLGYSGWGPHQLIGEIKSGAWINLGLSLELIFDTKIDQIWKRSFEIIGIDPQKLFFGQGEMEN